MNGDLGKGPASTAVYATNAIEQTLMGSAAGMAVISTGPGGPTLQPATIMQTTLVPAQAIAAAEYALINGNMLTTAAAAAPTEAADYYQNDGGGGGGGTLSPQHTMSPTENHSNSTTGGGGQGGAVISGNKGAIVTDTTGIDNGIPLERLKKLLTAQIEYYFSW